MQLENVYINYLAIILSTGAHYKHFSRVSMQLAKK